MSLEQFYSMIGGSYSEAIGRLMDEKRIRKYLGKFINASDYSDLCTALDQQRWEDAFRFSHNLKGMGLNLSLGRLASSSNELCEALRNGPPTIDISALRQEVAKEFELVSELVRRLPE